MVHLLCGAMAKPITNNQAEYLALLYGMQVATEHQITNLTVQGDSELVTRQLSGRYSVRSEVLRPLHAKVKELSKEHFGSVTATHVMRERNKMADGLANIAMDAAQASAKIQLLLRDQALPEVDRKAVIKWLSQKMGPSKVITSLPKMVERLLYHQQPEVLSRILQVQDNWPVCNSSPTKAAASASTADQGDKLSGTVVANGKLYSVYLCAGGDPFALTPENIEHRVSAPLYLHLLIRLLRQALKQ